MRLNLVLLLLCSAALTNCLFDISDFGAVANSDIVNDQFKTQRAILSAIKAANSSQGERIVRIPNKKYYSMPIRVDYVHNVTL